MCVCVCARRTVIPACSRPTPASAQPSRTTPAAALRAHLLDETKKTASLAKKMSVLALMAVSTACISEGTPSRPGACSDCLTSLSSSRGSELTNAEAAWQVGSGGWPPGLWLPRGLPDVAWGGVHLVPCRPRADLLRGQPTPRQRAVAEKVPWLWLCRWPGCKLGWAAITLLQNHGMLDGLRPAADATPRATASSWMPLLTMKDRSENSSTITVFRDRHFSAD